ncbi:hypothetical protein ACM01_33510 [Streptomyces viridochromogenes]|uniref:Uncharacterized protein n=1 Tax=Streptomyces viridochromogenes TaxID=1938 RepID=A0A0J7Z1W8_STRVR|nr:hypothetical protein [Streptomyces viridochromogenes]KMS69739.1 hypothetical protein ACM01_33510 [Streptomyces viridochromogenes]KOG13740.1 hypothetical protein ADK36_32520 [Streptomyces viridochromogenes]KOG16584.1 hypothetical protein ADK35_26915 [Streptomyces viridochromogenes]
MRKIAYVFGALAATGAGTYLIVYLYRWQWQRALICGVLLLVVEVMLFGLMALGRLNRIEDRLRAADRRQRELDARTEDVLTRLREPAVAREETRFRWLEDPAERSYVFVPVLMVAGVVLSGLAWVVQKVASASTGPAERRLAGRLAVLAAPDPAAPDGSDDLDDLPPLGAGASRGRTARLTTMIALCAALLAALIVGLADLTKTREEEANESEATSVVVQVDLRGVDVSAARRSLAAQQIWETCRDSTSVPLRHATLGELGDGMFAGVVRPALTEHDLLRLRGCLEDATLERAHLTVVAVGDVDPDDN